MVTTPTTPAEGSYPRLGKAGIVRKNCMHCFVNDAMGISRIDLALYALRNLQSSDKQIQQF